MLADHGAEAARGEVLHRGSGSLQAQQLLRGEDDQRLARAAVGLAAQQVEVRRRCGRVGHDHVLFGAHLHEALDACRGVVRALAFVAVRQHQHQRGTLAPLLLGRGDELVDDGLGAVDEVTELGLPHNQGVGTLHGVAVLEAHGSVFAEQGIVDPQLGLVLAEFRSGVQSLPLARSWNTAWRCTKVPRRESWPAMRTGTPSSSSEPKALSSPKPQSMLPSRDMASRFSSSGLSFW